MRTVPPLNNSLLKHPGANTPGLFTVFNILFISYSIAVKISPTAPTIPSSGCIAVSWVSLAALEIFLSRISIMATFSMYGISAWLRRLNTWVFTSFSRSSGAPRVMMISEVAAVSGTLTARQPSASSYFLEASTPVPSTSTVTSVSFTPQNSTVQVLFCGISSSLPAAFWMTKRPVLHFRSMSVRTHSSFR